MAGNMNTKPDRIFFDCPKTGLQKINLSSCCGKCSDKEISKCDLRNVAIHFNNYINMYQNEQDFIGGKVIS